MALSMLCFGGGRDGNPCGGGDKSITKPLFGIDRNSINNGPPVQVWARALPGGTNRSQNVTLLKEAPDLDSNAGEVVVACGDTLAMFEYHDISVDVLPASEADDARCGCTNRCARGGGDVHAEVMTSLTVTVRPISAKWAGPASSDRCDHGGIPQGLIGPDLVCIQPLPSALFDGFNVSPSRPLRLCQRNAPPGRVVARTDVNVGCGCERIAAQIRCCDRHGL